MKSDQFYNFVFFLFVTLFGLLTRVNCQSSIYRLSGYVTPKIYTLFLQVDVDFYSFSGNVTVDFQVNQATSTIDMHNIGLTILNNKVFVNSNNDDVIFESVYLLYNNETEIMTIGLDRTLATNTNHSLTISFSGRIEYDMKGLYMSSYYDDGIKYIATTFSAAAYARKIFPCFDEPSYKAVFRMKISCREKYLALANTKVAKIDYENDWLGTWNIIEFEETPPMSSYLLAFTISDFKNITNFYEPEFSVYASSKEYSNMQFALNVGREALKALEKYTGIQYSLNKMDFIAIDDFLYGAMENWGLISFKTSRIVNPNGERNHRKIQSIITIITHELVHQYFGNLVTCEWWDYVWLNEGFARYLEHTIADMILPDWRIGDQFIATMHSVMLDDVKPKTHAMTYTVETPDEITKIYDFVAYPKAASVIRMIENILTTKIFQKALKLYLSERQFGTATDEQLFDALERTKIESGLLENIPSVSEIFRSWTQNPGYPILNVNYSRNTKKIKFSQEQFMPQINETEASDFFILFNYVTSQRASTDYWLPEKSEWYWIKNDTEIATRELELTIDGDPEWIICNLLQTGYYRVNYNNDNWKTIIQSLDSNTFHIIHAQNRAQLLDDSFNLAKANYLNFQIILNMLKYLKREYELMPITAGFNAIEFMLRNLDEMSSYDKLTEIMHEIIDDIYVRINYPDNPEYPRAFSENHLEVLKLTVNLFTCRWGAPTCISDSRTHMFLNDLMISQPHINERPHIYCGALHGDLASNYWNQLKLRLTEITTTNEIYRDNQEEISEIIYAFSSCDFNLNRVERFLSDIFNKSQPFSYENISNDDASTAIRNLIMTSSKHRELVMDFYFEQYEIVNETVPLKSILGVFSKMINTQNQLNRLTELGILLDFDVDDALLEIKKNIDWMLIKLPEIETWVKSEKGDAFKMKISISALFLLILLTFFLNNGLITQ